MISTKNIVKNSMAYELGGFRKVIRPGEQPKVKLPEKLQKRIDDSQISTDEYIALEQFAKLLPRGLRKLKLNMPELRAELLSNQRLNAMTDSQGLRKGGFAALSGNQKGNARRGTKVIKELNQEDLLFTIKNKNRLKARTNFDRSVNPNYTSFKNNFKIS